MQEINIKGKSYVEVSERIIEFRSNPKYEGYTLTTQIISLENGICTIMANIHNPNGVLVATGTAQEKEDSSFINKTSFIENCETSAWGRALGNLGIGVLSSIASADEVINAINNQEKLKKNETKSAKKIDEINNQLDAQIEKEQNKLTCADCGKEINRTVHDYSSNKFGKPLCMDCQKQAKKLKSA